MTEVVVASGQKIVLSKVKGNLKIGKSATLIAEKNEIIIDGSVVSTGGFICEGNLIARNLKVMKGSAEIIGNLELHQYAHIEQKLDVSGSFTCPDISVGGSLHVEENVQSEMLKTGGVISIGKNAQVETIKVGGSLKIYGESNIGTILVGGSVKLFENSTVDEIKVGGLVQVTRGCFGTIKVGGSFHATEKIEIGIIDVGGSIRMDSSAKINDLEVRGSCTLNSSLEFNRLDVGGSITIIGNAEGKSIRVGGSITCNESLTCLDKLIVGGWCSVKTVLRGKEIDIGGKINVKYIKANYFRIRRRGEVKGIIDADIIVISSRATSEDLYGIDIRIEENAQVKRIFGENIVIGDGAKVLGEVQYTNELFSHDNVKFSRKPIKVKFLPKLTDH